MTEAPGVLHRAACLLRILAEGGVAGMRLTELAEAIALPRPSVHRVLRSMVEERLLDFDARSKRYTLALALFELAARAGNRMGLRQICRPVLLRLTESLGETLFLLVRDGYEAVCIDRSTGPFAIRSFTGDIGGRVPLGIGQGAMVMLAFLPQEEQDEVIRHNLPRLRELDGTDEATLRAELAQVRRAGHCGRAFGIIPGQTGLAVPILDREGRAVAALSIGSTIEHLTAERSSIIATLMKTEAAAVAAQINPFDPVLRRASAAMEIAAG
ncbi:IclR family transcriptional regulator [Plastoroseomonas hellenica]|uniref:IclR family transcriptional regulator n=1 Tax=Plastoroseomonas hellenica TaxID=2687306 RepID=UPI001BAA9309|nr:IclR family transcriptional regulator [Plastoroseomonas hellenica]MBR0644226.1 IclR family transcriptional regulator [Plastoroseomonas hellenica]